MALQYNDGYQENVFSFANNINTREGGTHLTGFRAALTGTLSAYAQANNFLKSFKGGISGDDVREGLTAVVSVRLPEPQFEGQTKAKLGNSDIKGLVQQIVNDKLAEAFEEDPTTARKIVDKCVRAAQAREAARKARDLSRKGGRDDEGLVGQARRLLGARPAVPRAVPGGGRLGGRLRQAGPRPAHAGGAAAARQDHQLREGALRQGAVPQRNPAAHLGHGHRYRHRGVRPRQAALPQGRPDDGRRRGRRPHPDPAPHLLLPPHDRGHRVRTPLHRPAAPLQGEEGPRREVSDERAGVRGVLPGRLGGERHRQGAGDQAAAHRRGPAGAAAAGVRVPGALRQADASAECRRRSWPSCCARSSAAPSAAWATTRSARR